MLTTIHVTTRQEGIELWIESCFSPLVGILIVYHHSDNFTYLIYSTINEDLLERFNDYTSLYNLFNFLCLDK